MSGPVEIVLTPKPHDIGAFTVNRALPKRERRHLGPFVFFDHLGPAALKPGEPIGRVFDAYARVCDAAGMQAHRLNACGYSLGTTFAPNWHAIA